MHITYLIDQQCSERLVVGKTAKPSYQPIIVRTETPMLKCEEEVLRLSRTQALGLAAMLLKASEDLKVIDETRCTYPGCVIGMDGFDHDELEAIVEEHAR